MRQARGRGVRADAMENPLASKVSHEIHPFVQHTHDQDAALDFPVKDGMAATFHLHITGPDMIDIAAHIGKFCETFKCLMQTHYVNLGTGEAPFLHRISGYLDDIVIGLIG
jgi:hypothetical protein